MIRWKRLFYYLLINILVSACTTLTVLIFWERLGPSGDGEPGQMAAFPAAVLTAEPDTFLPTPEPSPQPTPTRALATYRVVAGDTLSVIALQFSISLNELMEINGIEDPDSLGSGQVIFVPAATPTIPAATPTPHAAPPQEEQVNIGIVLIVGAGDLPTERVRIEKKGEGYLSLAGWRLTGEDGEDFTFPQLALYQEFAIDVYTRKGSDTAAALFWGLDQPAWKSGELVKLLSPSGVVVSQMAAP
jgi:hypothetical protein